MKVALHFSKLFHLAVGVGLVATLSAACSDDSDNTSASLDNLVITTQSWKTTEFNANVVKLLVEKNNLGPKTVELKFKDEYEQWAELASGTSHVSLENWPSGHKDDITKYVEPGLVENLGVLGAQAKIGWYVPTYLTVADPSLKTVDAYKDAAKASAFKTPETGENGRILIGDKTWVSNEEAIISNLGLKLQIGYAGGEDALIAELDAAYNKQAPILIQLWIPHAALTKYDMTPVELKPYSDACYADATKIDCDYPSDALFKAAWPQVKTQSPRVHKLLKGLQLSTKDQVNALRAMSVDGKSAAEAAQAWIDANPTIWQPWVAP